jgi:hypothetical protein
MVAFDTTFLTLMFIPGANHPIGDAKKRVEFLISDIHGSGEKILLPTPALAEILIKSGKARNQILQELSKAAKFEIAPFDLRAALELSLMSDAALTAKDKKGGATGTWVKVKFDRQIVAIAKVAGATKIYSEDESLRNTATREGLTALGVADIEFPKPDQSGFWVP